MDTTLENIILIIIYAIGAYVLYKLVSSLFNRQQEEEEEVDLTEFIKKVQKEFDFHWTTYQTSPNSVDDMDAYVCGKTGYVYAKIVHNEPLYTIHVKGELLGDYTNRAAARQAVEHHINTLSMIKRVSVK